MEGSEKLNIRIFSVAFLIILILNLYLFKGMVHALAFAAITAGSFYPLFIKAKKRFKLSQELAAALITVLIVVLILIPLIAVIFQVSKETVTLYSNIKEGLSLAQVKDFFFGKGPIGTLVHEVADLLGMEVNLDELYRASLEKAQSYSGKIFGTVNSWVSDTISFLFNFLIMILAIYTIFVEGENIKRFTFRLSPLPDEQEQTILTKFSQMNFVTLVCNGVGGLIQGILAGVALWLCDFSSIFLWSTVMVILAFIPLLGIIVVTLPASLYLMVTGKLGEGLALFTFCSVLALVVENWFKPKFMGKRIQVNSLLVLFYIIAGMGTFGMAGIFYGPLLCIIFLTMVDIFQEYYLPKFS